MTIKTVFLLLAGTCSCQGTYFISTEVSHWSNASRHCEVAAPPITYTPRGNVVDVDIDISENEAVWIGYYSVVKVFEYIGCVNKIWLFTYMFQEEKRPNSVEMNKSPDVCFRRCRSSKLIGVTSSECFCLGNSDLRITKEFKNTKCTAPCLHPPGIACGSEDYDETYVSLYRLNVNAFPISKSIQNIEREKYCLSLRVNLIQREFLWEDCRRRLEIECYTGYMSIIIHANMSWFGSANTCFQTRLSPTSYENSKSVRNDSVNTVWTGLFKTQIVYRFDKYDEDKEVGEVQFGLLTKTPANEYLLRFDKDISKRRILCQKDTFDYLIVLGVLVLLFIVAAGGLTAFCKRRQLLKCLQNKAQSTSPIIPSSTDSHDGDHRLDIPLSTASSDGDHGPDIPSSTDSRDGYQTHIYYILEPHEREMSAFDRTNNTVIPVQQDPSYDSIITGSSEARRDTDHVYNSIDALNCLKEKKGDSEYDKPNTQKEGQGRDTDNMYHKLDIRSEKKIDPNPTNNKRHF